MFFFFLLHSSDLGLNVLIQSYVSDQAWGFFKWPVSHSLTKHNSQSLFLVYCLRFNVNHTLSEPHGFTYLKSHLFSATGLSVYKYMYTFLCLCTWLWNAEYLFNVFMFNAVIRINRRTEAIIQASVLRLMWDCWMKKRGEGQNLRHCNGHPAWCLRMRLFCSVEKYESMHS